MKEEMESKWFNMKGLIYWYSETDHRAFGQQAKFVDSAWRINGVHIYSEGAGCGKG